MRAKISESSKYLTNEFDVHTWKIAVERWINILCSCEMLVWREIGLYVFHLDFEFYAKYKCRHLMIFKAKLNAQIFCAVIKHLINHTATIHFGYSMLRYKNYDSYQTLRPVFHFNWIENRWALSRQTPSLSLVCNDLKNAYCTPFQYLLTFSIRHEYTITISNSPLFV